MSLSYRPHRSVKASVLILCASILLLIPGLAKGALVRGQAGKNTPPQPSPATEAVVRGQILKTAPAGNAPAAGIAVTVFNPQSKTRSVAVTSAANGIYYLYNVPYGAYYLEVWPSQAPGAAPLRYQISVTQPITNIAPIVLP